MGAGIEKISLRDLLSVPGREPALVLEAIRNGADVDSPGESGFTPLMLAVLLNDDPSIVRALIDAGADVDASTREGMTALMWALSTETPDMEGGNSGEFAARERRRVEAATLLLRSGACVNIACRSPHRMKWTPLLFATLDPDRNAGPISLMLDAGADPNARTAEEITPLFHAAAFCRSSEIVRALIRAGADVNAEGKREGREGWTPLLYALAGPCRSLPVVEELLGSGASVNIAVGNGQTPLHFAVSIGDVPGYVHALLRAGADVHARNGDGGSALDCALARNFKNVVGRLRRAAGA